MPRTFPATRSDGTFSVASRFDGPAEALGDVEVEVAKSIQRIQRDGAVLESEFSSSPRVERDGETIVVIFDGKPGAKLWKDWLVAVTRDVDRSLSEIRFREFYDLVAGSPATP